MIRGFSFARCPTTYFGEGAFDMLEGLVAGRGRNVLLVTGASSLEASGKMGSLVARLGERGVDCPHLAVPGEPSVELVDGAVSSYRGRKPDLVVSIGGGSAIDTGKAISAMLEVEGSVMDYLEGVGKGLAHPGDKVPFIAVPTTAGTGSEATKNAVISWVGQRGFKKSLRHDNLVPDVAVVDPVLSLSCPPMVTASCGMDAVTQLLESYVSTAATPMTDALALSGLKQAFRGLVPAVSRGAEDLGARSEMAYASYISGITLANAGLGLVHGFAAAIGGMFEIPHGVACGALLASVTRANIGKLREKGSDDDPCLSRYARAARILLGGLSDDEQVLCDSLADHLQELKESMKIPALGAFGVRKTDANAIVERTSHKNNPVRFSEGEMMAILVKSI